MSDMYVVGMILKGKGATGFVNVRSGRLWDADIARGTQHVKPYPMLGGGVRLVSQKKKIQTLKISGHFPPQRPPRAEIATGR